MKTWLACASSLVALTCAVPAQAEEAPAREPVNAEDIVVIGEIGYRDRVDGPAPVLEFGPDYFQRFEPRTVGDMLKRTPSAAFVGSDMGEFDDLQIRGLGAGYTQILIDGERVPGSGFDRSFFVDRIPAELVERVEIVRSPSANRSGDAVAGALNIVMRDAYSLNGGYVRAGVLSYSDDELEGALSGVWGGALGPARLLLGASYQGRHNPKDKFSQRFTSAPGGVNWEGDPSYTLNDIETQDDIRDGEDYTLNASLIMPVGAGELQLEGVFVRTEREELEDSLEFDDVGDLITIVPGYAFIQQDNMQFQADFEHPLFGGQFKVDFAFARFEEDTTEGETETELDGAGLIDAFAGEEETLRFTDDEYSFSLAQEFNLAENLRLEFGLDWAVKERDGALTTREFEFDGVAPIGDAPPYVGDPWTDPDADLDSGLADGGNFLIEEERLDPYVMFSGVTGAFEWEAGLRYETTDVEVTDRDAPFTASNSYDALLPSAHLRWNLTDDDRLNFSVARTVRRPSFRYIMPTTFEGEFEDNDFVGNPGIDAETAWGIDIGFEHRLGRVGVIGVNVFYRDVQDVLEIYNTGNYTGDYLDDYQDWLDDGNVGTIADYAADEDAPFVYEYSARNTGDGQVWGVEIDLSTPLTVIGLENTGVFVNYSWLDSEIEDEFGTRRFNNQAEYVFNVGFIHDMPNLGAAFGATYRQQGDAFSRVLGEEVETSYGADLEIFAEKRFGERLSLRFTASNLLDASKDETYGVFQNDDHQRNRLYDEYELETETTGPVYQLVGRYAF